MSFETSKRKMGRGISFFLLILLTMNVIFLTAYTAAVTNHVHLPRGADERELDGPYNPRDKKHRAKGEHNVEFDHEAILGSQKDVQEFNQLTVPESKRRLRILVKRMDLNRDGYINRVELRAWIIRSFRLLSKEESDERFEDADTNEDNLVTWNEYVLDTFGTPSDDIDIHDEEVAEHDKAIFDMADKNKDGALDKNEFLFFSHPEEQPEMFPLLLKQALNEKDWNDDGVLDFKEYVGNKARDHDQTWLIAEKTKFDEEYDQDKDGVLNINEMRLWLIPSNEKIAEEETEHLFAECDDNADNLLSMEEVIDHHDIFVGSEATDFGDHLQNIHVYSDEL